jgi:hypothetical protein
MSYTAEATYRRLYHKTPAQIIDLLKATGIDPSTDYDDHPHATFFDMGVLHLMTRLDLSHFSRVINEIEDAARQPKEPEPIYWSYDLRAGDEAAIMAEETGIDYSRCLVMCNMD